MSTSEYGGDGVDLLQEALALIREQQEKLRSLNEKAKSLYKRLSEEREQIEAALQQMDQILGSTSASAAAQERAGLIEKALLRDEEQSLRQRELGLSERLELLRHTLQSLQWLIKHTEVAARFAHRDFDPWGEDDEQTAKLTQMRAVQSQEVERQRLAREVHDGPAQVLANAIFELEYCERLLTKDPERVAAELAKLKQDVRDGLVEVRHFIFDLRPAPRRDTGLQNILREYTENYQSRFDIRVITELSDVGRHPVGQETAIYRIVQEALQNVQKHSRAAEVRLELRRDDKSLIAVVEDNGVGFDVQEQMVDQVGHFGLTSMSERSQLIGGELEIVSAPDHGTRVTLTVPLSVYKPEA